MKTKSDIRIKNKYKQPCLLMSIEISPDIYF